MAVVAAAALAAAAVLGEAGQVGQLWGAAGAAGEETHFLEAENFTLGAQSCWSPQPWADNYYACTFLDGGSAFLSRKAFLGAPAVLPAGAGRCVASATATVGTAGLFAPLVRFEPLCREPACFETPFELTLTQVTPPPLTSPHLTPPRPTT